MLIKEVAAYATALLNGIIGFRNIRLKVNKLVCNFFDLAYFGKRFLKIANLLFNYLTLYFFSGREVKLNIILKLNR